MKQTFYVPFSSVSIHAGQTAYTCIEKAKEFADRKNLPVINHGTVDRNEINKLTNDQRDFKFKIPVHFYSGYSFDGVLVKEFGKWETPKRKNLSLK